MGRPYKITDAQESVLLEIVRADQFSTLGEIKHELKRRTGLDVHERTVVTMLLRLGFERRTGTEAIMVKAVESGVVRYGYTDKHREHKPEQLFSSCLTDHE